MIIQQNLHNSCFFFFLRTNNIVQIKNESVNYKRKTWPSDILIYVNKIEFVNRHISMVLDTSMISPLSVLLFSQTDVQCKKVCF